MSADHTVTPPAGRLSCPSCGGPIHSYRASPRTMLDKQVVDWTLVVNPCGCVFVHDPANPFPLAKEPA